MDPSSAGALIAELNERLRTLTDPDAVLQAAVDVIGRGWQVGRAAFAEPVGDGSRIRVTHEYLDGMVSALGERDTAPLGRAVAEAKARGVPLFIDDVEADPRMADARELCRAFGIRATAIVPLLRDGRFAVNLFLNHPTPRAWNLGSAALLEQLVERVWSTVERARASRALQASEARLRLAISGGRMGTWWLDLPEMVITWSEQRARLFGLPPERTSLAHEEWRRLVHPDDLANAEAALRDCAEGRSDSYEAEYRVTWPDGSEHVLASTGTLMRGSDGKRLGIAGVVRDVTERRRIETELRRLTEELERRVEERTRALALSEAHYRAYWEHTAESLFSIEVTPEGRLQYEALNPALEATLGRTSAEVAGRTAHEVLPAAEASAVEAAYRRCAESGQPVAYHATLETPTGPHTFEAVLAPVRDVTTGRVVRILGSARDVTARLRAEQQLRQSQKMEAIGQLTGGVAHDFNNLLTGVVGALELLARRVGEDERSRRLIESATVAAERGARLIRQLLAFSRQQRLEPAPIDLNEVVEAMQGLLRSTLGGQLQVKLALEPSLWAAMADRTQVELVLLNLAINARDAMGGAGSIVLATTNVERGAPERAEEPPAGSYVALSVADGGTGMTPEVRAHIFEPFFTTKPVGKGTGLGLPQVLGVAQQMGGGVAVDTAPGRGTTVTVFFPKADERPRAAQPAAPEASARVSLADAAVMVVDDDEDARRAALALLEELGCRPHGVASGPAALEALEAGCVPDAVLMDVAMPDMGGVETARRMRAALPGLPILLMSGYAESATVSQIDAPLVGKPFRAAELGDALARAMARPAAAPAPERAVGAAYSVSS